MGCPLATTLDAVTDMGNKLISISNALFLLMPLFLIHNYYEIHMVEVMKIPMRTLPLCSMIISQELYKYITYALIILLVTNEIKTKNKYKNHVNVFLLFCAIISNLICYVGFIYPFIMNSNASN